jgi:hypothetical protein
MAENSLERFVEGVRSAWGPLSSELIAACRHHLEELLKAPETEDWLAALKRDAPASRELYRDPEHGFLLLAHAEPAGQSRPPHDHGRGWVFYGVQQGLIEMRTYARVSDADGTEKLVEREIFPIPPGQCRVFLPGDVHDTRSSDPTLIYRFTSRDLIKEDKDEHRVRRYVERDGAWVERAA